MAANQAAVYAGSFDPPTLGHLDVVRRIAPLFSTIHLVVAKNYSKKNTLFTPEERAELLRESLSKILPKNKFQVHVHGGLVVNICKRLGVRALVRGLRAMSDFEKEFQIATMNRRLAPQIETLHVMTDEKYFFVSSTLVKEVASFESTLKELVPKNVARALKKRLKEQRK